MDLPVPVIRRVDLLAERRRVEHEVVRRTVEARRRAARAPGGSPPRSPGRRRRAARPKSASWRRGTIQTSNGERDANGAKATVSSSCQTRRSGRRGSSRTSRHHGHSPSRITNRAAPPELLGDPVRDLGQVVEVEAEVVGPGARLGAPVLDELEVVGLARRARARRPPSRARADEPLDDLVADRVERPVLAGRRDDRPPAAAGARLRRAPPGPARHPSSRDSSSVPTTWNAKSLSIRVRIPAPSGRRQFWQSPRSSIGSAAWANRSRWNARSTTVATHQPVIGSLRSSKRPAAIGQAVAAMDRGDSQASGAPMRPANAVANASPARATAAGSVAGASSAPARRSSAAIDVETRPGMPHGSIRSKSARSGATFRAMP